MELVILKVFNNGIEAHILRNSLEAEGIQCFIQDENIVTVNPLYNFAVGGVKLKVREDDLESARMILSEIEGKPYSDDTDAVISCPKCGATDLYADFKSIKSVGSILATITAFLLTVFPIYTRSVYKCKKCDWEFEIKPKNK